MAESLARIRVVDALYDASPAAQRHGSIEPASAVVALTPYEAVSSQAALDAMSERRSVLKLDWNESTIPPSPKVTAAIAKFLTEGPGLNWYPQLGSESLLNALSEYTSVAADHILVSNGSDDALHLICATFLDHGDEVVVPVPTYNHFVVFARSRGAVIKEVRGKDPFCSNLPGIRDALSATTRMLYLVSPNNPTGIVYSPEEVAALAGDYPQTLIILDEAYFEFHGVSGIALVDQFPNLMVTRTFSKAFGLAGLRVGYLAADPSILEGLRRLYNPKSVNAIAQIGAEAALSDLGWLQDFIAEVDQSRQILGDFFRNKGIEVHETPANFLVLRVDDVPGTLQRLESRGVYVRDRSSYPGLQGCIRMTLGTVEQSRRLVELLDDLF